MNNMHIVSALRQGYTAELDPAKEAEVYVSDERVSVGFARRRVRTNQQINEMAQRAAERAKQAIWKTFVDAYEAALKDEIAKARAGAAAEFAGLMG